MFQTRKTIKVKIPQPRWLYRKKELFEKLVDREGMYQDSWRYRMMLDQAAPRDYVESSSTGQSGNIVHVIRDRNGFPVCFEVKDSNGYDFISVDRVDLWEQYTFIPNSYGYYGDDKDAMCWEWEA